MAQFEKYGLNWNVGTSSLDIEKHMIRSGGQWIGKQGQTLGNGLFFHFKELEKLLWPTVKVWHKWNELQLKEWLAHRTIGILGPSSSGKTNSAATDTLADYYCWPECTTVLICSTTKERMQDRIFGEIKKYHRLARERYPDLPGYSIDGRMRIVTESKDDARDGRDFRNGICFPTGTLVDAPGNQIPIEKLKVGDEVLNATGTGTVTKLFTSVAQYLVRVRFSSGSFFDCTPNHRVLTQKGWVKAVDLETSDMVYSACETMQIMREADAAGVSQSEVLHGRVRVDSVEVLEPRSDERFNKSQGGYTVHNISVSGHPSYSVQNAIVHNCGVACLSGGEFKGIAEFIGIKNKRMRVVMDELQMLPPSVLMAISNLDKNDDLKVVGLGNPKETTDALGMFCEPSYELGGWDGGVDQTPKTKVWDTRRPDGICIQLVGSESPNLDGSLGIPLITQEAIDRDIAQYGKDSLQFTMMNQGMMPRGQGSRRVLTRQLCLKNKAMDDPEWLSSDRTKIGFLDAAGWGGSGGDRCIFGELQFGYEATTINAAEMDISNLVHQAPSKNSHKQIVALVDFLLVPINVLKTDDSPEEQIVNFVREQCSTRNIPPQNFFFDSGMKASLVSQFGKSWSPQTNPIDCGGRPTDRMVSQKIQISCKDYYDRLITEFWFSVRLVVVAGQFRGMKEGCMTEFCQREWTRVGANKTSVEPKDKMKEKSGRSPDLADAVAIGIEGARRLGLKIDEPVNREFQQQTQAWKTKLRQKSEEQWKVGSLTY